MNPHRSVRSIVASGLFLFLGTAQGTATLAAQATDQVSSPPPPAQTEIKRPRLSATQVSELQAKADAGDVSAETALAKAYREGNGVPQNDELALKWFRKAADQGDAGAENDLGIMYRMGEGVAQDKEEAARWYAKAARRGNPEGMFNLGVSYYNGDGVGSNEFVAYAWFLLAQAAGDTAAEDPVRRSAAAMSDRETAAAFMRIAAMYEKGEELPKDDAESVRWLRKAAEIDSAGKVRLADHLLAQPSGQRDYAEALELCKAAKEFRCVGDIYRKGLGVPQNPAEAEKWYRKAVLYSDVRAMVALGDMYSTGEGVKVDRPAAFLLFFRASQRLMPGAAQRAGDLLGRLDNRERQQVERKLRDQRFDPKKVFAALQGGTRPSNER